jgi:hypothetical protein
MKVVRVACMLVGIVYSGRHDVGTDFHLSTEQRTWSVVGTILTAVDNGCVD